MSEEFNKLNRDMGRLEARMDAIEAEVGDLKALVIKKFDTFETMLTAINAYIVERKTTSKVTGWFVAKIVGVLSALGGIFYAVLKVFTGQ